jgi:hypothetical protein
MVPNRHEADSALLYEAAWQRRAEGWGGQEFMHRAVVIANGRHRRSASSA